MDNKETLVIEGLGGERTLSGKIAVGGAKNAVLKVLASSILFKDEINLVAVPDIEDVARTLEILQDLGVGVTKEGDKAYKLLTNNIKSSVISPEISKKLRASIVIAGPLLARFGEVSFPHPGGCVIGKRPIDLFLDNFALMGATVTEEDGMYKVRASGKKLRGANIFFRVQSVTNTETFMLAGVLAEGKTVLENCAMEPEIQSLGEFLISCGANISGLGTPTIIIEGGELLSGADKKYVTMPDRIEAGSFIILGALAAKDLTIANCEPKHLSALIYALKQSGVNLEVGEDFVRIFGNEKKTFLPLEIKTHEYPGFPTDLQAPMAIFLTQATGQSFIFETIWENRLNYLEAVTRMGAKARIVDSHRAFIDGPTPLDGREVESPDLRAGLAYVMAGIIARGQTIVHNVYYIDRGYERLDERLRQVGVNIQRTS